MLNDPIAKMAATGQAQLAIDTFSRHLHAVRNGATGFSNKGPHQAGKKYSKHRNLRPSFRKYKGQNQKNDSPQVKWWLRD